MKDLITPTPLHRVIYFGEQVDQETVASIAIKIIDINQSDKTIKKISKLHGFKYKPKPILIYIDSYGGSVYQIFGLISLIEKSKTPVYTYVTGTAMSAAFLLFLSGFERFVYTRSTLMYHQISSLAYGKVKDMEDDLKETMRLQTEMNTYVLDRTSITKEELEENFKTKSDWILTPSECLKYKIATNII